jgi:deazaflavin-dependent oxidoreductase (nitroreductase family)
MITMQKFAITTGGALFIAVAAIMIVFVTGLRRKSHVVRSGVRWTSVKTRRFTIRNAGTPGAYATIVRHVGRKSGRPYETPVRAAMSDDGFVITLPYGDDADWVKNVIAAGTATLVFEGAEVEVDKPEIVRGTDDAQLFAARDQRTQRLFGVDEYLHFHRCA